MKKSITEAMRRALFITQQFAFEEHVHSVVTVGVSCPLHLVGTTQHTTTHYTGQVLPTLLAPMPEMKLKNSALICDDVGGTNSGGPEDMATAQSMSLPSRNKALAGFKLQQRSGGGKGRGRSCDDRADVFCFGMYC